jgi:predicted enzyme related to lactoylglutathione lyase
MLMVTRGASNGSQLRYHARVKTRQPAAAARLGGAVIFAKHVDRLVAFYRGVLGLNVFERGKGHARIGTPESHLVIHRIPAKVAARIAIAVPPVRRAGAAIKPVFVVASLEQARTAVTKHGGVMDSADRKWVILGSRVCDACDPEGNVIQFRESSGRSRTPHLLDPDATPTRSGAAGRAEWPCSHRRRAWP